MFDNILGLYIDQLDIHMRQIVDEAVPKATGFDTMLRYAMGWIDEDGKPYFGQTGKRLRPGLLLLVTEAAGGNWRRALPAAAAVELLHNFSLIHDDIQDNSPTRHGRPTVWKIWGQANAINAGDAMFALSYSALESLSEHVPDELMLQVWRIFNRTNMELTRGQHLDMLFEQKANISIDDYISMIQGKSAALLAACAEIGALVGSGDRVLASHYAAFGLNIGIAFQIRDDILGIWGDPGIIGKSTATDIISRKKSLPVLFGLSNSTALTDIYQKPQFTDEDVDQAVQLLDRSGARGFTQEQEARFLDEALAALKRANPQGEAADKLRQFVDVLFKRRY